MADAAERARRWRLVLGVDGDDASARVLLGAADQRIDAALAALYGESPSRSSSRGRRGGLGGSAPRVSRWLGDIREYFPTPVVQVIQRDAFERLGLRRMLLEPEFLASLEADVHLVADLMSLGQAIPDKTKDTAREVVQKVVDELMARLRRRTEETIRGAINRARRTKRPRFADIDWGRTITANLRYYQPEHRTVIPERLVGFKRRSRSQTDLEHVQLCVDQSGSMATSVVYSSIFAAVMASLPGVDTQLVCFDTAIVDLTEQLEDPVDVLFGVQLGGGTDINQAVAYCEERIQQPSRTHLILITDLCEGGDASALVDRLGRLIESGVGVIVLLALSDEGHPYYDKQLANQVAALGAPVFACTPDQFPDLMATALGGGDVAEWVSGLGDAARPEPDV
ncbi:MAG: VWA domain-containing protein [Myxococcota bacterium]|nr:VWA domain-containing protein [Myxococcota bacterium]